MISHGARGAWMSSGPFFLVARAALFEDPRQNCSIVMEYITSGVLSTCHFGRKSRRKLCF